MSQKIQIICSSPGMRRHGVEHPASRIYDADQWTKDQIAAFQADPAFTVVVGVADGGVQLQGADIEAAVVARVEAVKLEMQASFVAAVADAVAERTSALKADHETALNELGKRIETASESLSMASKTLEERDTALLAANEKIADLEKQLTEAKKPAAAKK